jgi:hypothetical protein
MMGELLRVRFKRTFQVAVLLLIVGLSAAEADVTTVAGIEMRETKFSFGLVPYRAIVTHSFWLNNVTYSTIEIDRTDAGCSCSRMPLKQKLLEPGDSVAVKLILDTGKIPMRPFRRKSRVYLKDANSTKLEFLLTGACFNPENAKLKLVLEAPSARFSIADGDTLISFGITNTTEKDFRARLVSVPHDSPFGVQLPNRHKGRTRFTIPVVMTER